MSQTLELDRLPQDQVTDGALPRRQSHAATEARYRRIVVPVSLDAVDRGPLVLSFELAALHQSALTLLHVLPAMKSGLDAIDLLHHAVDKLRRPSSWRTSCGETRSEIQRFVNDVVPSHLLNAVRWREVCRTGELAESVAAEANETAADLVILPAVPTRWWLPQFFGDWSIRRRTRASVIYVRQPANLAAA